MLDFLLILRVITVLPPAFDPFYFILFYFFLR